NIDDVLEVSIQLHLLLSALDFLLGWRVGCCSCEPLAQRGEPLLGLVARDCAGRTEEHDRVLDVVVPEATGGLQVLAQDAQHPSVARLQELEVHVSLRRDYDLARLGSVFHRSRAEAAYAGPRVKD